MKTFLKVTLLLGLMVFLLLAAPLIASHLCGGFFSGMAALALLLVIGALCLALAIIGGGAALVVGLAVLAALCCAVVTALLPIALPVLFIAGLVVLVAKLARRRPAPATAA